MKLKKELKRSSELSLGTKFVVCLSLFSILVAPVAHADPVAAGEIIPPASARHITDLELLSKIDIGDPGEPAWCYSNAANAIIVTAPQREREKCELRLSYELEKLELRYKLQIANLELRVKSLQDEYDSMVSIKDQELEELEKISLSQPNNYWYVFLSSGVVVGALTTFFIMR